VASVTAAELMALLSKGDEMTLSEIEAATTEMNRMADALEGITP